MAPSRRVFLGSTAALGVGSVIGGGFLLGETNAQTQSGPDLVETELLTQLRDSVKAMRGARRGESARRVAGTLRIIAAHARAKNADATIRRHVRDAIRRDGKDAVVRRELDAEAFAAEMRQFGFVRPPALAAADYATREKVIDDLLANGATGKLVEIAATFDRLSAQLDEQPPLALISARQDGYQCPDLSGQIAMLQIVASVTCIVNLILCAAIQGAIAGLMIGILITGCPL